MEAAIMRIDVAGGSWPQRKVQMWREISPMWAVFFDEDITQPAMTHPWYAPYRKALAAAKHYCETGEKPEAQG